LGKRHRTPFEVMEHSAVAALVLAELHEQIEPTIGQDGPQIQAAAVTLVEAEVALRQAVAERNGRLADIGRARVGLRTRVGPRPVRKAAEGEGRPAQCPLGSVPAARA
jgi:hypothetical protein